MTAPEEDGMTGGAPAGSAHAGRAGQSGFSVAGSSSAHGGVASGGSSTTSSGGGSGGSADNSASAGKGGSASGGTTTAGSGAGGTVGGAGAQSCAEHQFTYAAGKALQSVHLSGSFNAWAAPGTPLVREVAGDTWQLSLGLAAGSYEYKFVLDGETWISDPTNPDTRNDTLGGVNSVITVVCP